MTLRCGYAAENERGDPRPDLRSTACDCDWWHLLPLLVFISLLGATAPAQAEPGDDVLDVTGTLVDTRTDPPKPVPDVTISVEIDGKVVASGTSDAEGRYSIPLPGTPDELVGQKITVKLDTTTLPPGTTLTDEKNTSRTVTIKTNFDIPIGYRIGPEADDSSEIVRKASRRASSTASSSACCSPSPRSASRSSSARPASPTSPTAS